MPRPNYNAQLRQRLLDAGYEIEVVHYHPKDTPKGGATTVLITSPEGHKSSGSAVCSASDNFNRKAGVKIALRRAMSYVPREERVRIFSAPK